MVLSKYWTLSVREDPEVLDTETVLAVIAVLNIAIKSWIAVSTAASTVIDGFVTWVSVEKPVILKVTFWAISLNKSSRFWTISSESPAWPAPTRYASIASLANVNARSYTALFPPPLKFAIIALIIRSTSALHAAGPVGKKNVGFASNILSIDSSIKSVLFASIRDAVSAKDPPRGAVVSTASFLITLIIAAFASSNAVMDCTSSAATCPPVI